MILIKRSFVALLLFAYVRANAQSNKQIIVHTQHIGLVLTVGKNNRVYQSYLDKRLLNDADLAALSLIEGIALHEFEMETCYDFVKPQR